MRIRAFLLLMWLTGVTTAATLDSLVVQNRQGQTSLMCTLHGPMTYKAFVLPHPWRLAIDFNQTTSSLNLNKVVLGNGMMLHVRSGHPHPGVLRVVFHLKQNIRLKTSVLTSRDAKEYRLRVDLFSDISMAPLRGEEKTKNQKQHPVRLSQRSVDKRPIPKASSSAPYVRTKKRRDVVIVLDPGHGGKDPGAMGPGHISEKNVVLAIAMNLKQRINSTPGFRAVLTRQADHYVGLRERLNLARRYNADVFISIHADAFIHQNSTGVSVFALSQNGATSEAARWLAEKENYSELGGVNLSGLDDRTGVIRTVLLDLSQTATIRASLQMGSRILHHMSKVASLHNRSVEQARFVVLKSPDIPSVLIETGFITNPIEEKNLSHPRYQMRLTQAIWDGLKGYFMDYPPHGTRLEAASNVKLHIVHSGETWSAIAARYHVTVDAIKSANHISSLPLKAGQKLNIPTVIA